VPNGRPRRIMRVPFDRGNGPVPSWPSPPSGFLFLSPLRSLSSDVTWSTRYLCGAIFTLACVARYPLLAFSLSLSLSLCPASPPRHPPRRDEARSRAFPPNLPEASRDQGFSKGGITDGMCVLPVPGHQSQPNFRRYGRLIVPGSHRWVVTHVVTSTARAGGRLRQWATVKALRRKLR